MSHRTAKQIVVALVLMILTASIAEPPLFQMKNWGLASLFLVALVWLITVLFQDLQEAS